MIKKAILSLVLLLMILGEATAGDAVVFTAGQPSDNYQVVITSALLSEAFKKNGVNFSVKSYPNIRSIEMANSGETGNSPVSTTSKR